MKKLICLIISVILIMLALPTAIYAGETAVAVRAQGEDDTVVTTNFKLSSRKVQEIAGADGGAWALYQAGGTAAPEDDGSEYFIKFTLTVPQAGKYVLSTNAGITANWQWCGAPFSVTVNSQPAVSSKDILSEVPEGAASDKALRHYNFGQYELQKGQNTVLFKPLETTGTGNYIVYIDYVELSLVPEESEDPGVDSNPDSEQSGSIIIEGEDYKEYTGDEPQGTYVMTKTGASGGKFLNYNSSADAAQGFDIVYEFNVTEADAYNLYFTGASYSSAYLSKGKIKIDDGEFVNMDAAVLNLLGNSEVSDFETLIQRHAYKQSFELEEGKHTITVRVDNKRQSGGATYFYMIDCFEFVKDGVILSGTYSSDGGALALGGSINGRAKNDLSGVNVSYTAIDPHIAVLTEDGKIVANGDGNARFKAVATYGDKTYEAETNVKCWIGDVEILSAERIAGGVKIILANHSESTKVMTLYAVRRGVDKIAAEVVPQEVSLDAHATGVVKTLTFTELSEDDTIDYFIIGVDKKPLSLCHSL